MTTSSSPIFTQGIKKTWQREQQEQKMLESQVDTWELLDQNIWNEALKTSQEG